MQRTKNVPAICRDVWVDSLFRYYWQVVNLNDAMRVLQLKLPVVL